MRIRAALVAVAAVLLAVSACSTEAGPTPKAGAPDPGPGALKVKLEALTVDVCFKTPAELEPPDCQKYVTQLASIPETVQQFAGSDYPELSEAARDLRKGVDAYRAKTCGTSGPHEQCTQALVDIAAAVGKVKERMATLPEVTGQSG